MVNRAQRRRLKSKKRMGRNPQADVREHGEVQLGVSVKHQSVVMTLVGPDGQTMVLGVPPDSARQFALALDEAAESLERGGAAPVRQQHVAGCFQSGPAETCEDCAALERYRSDEGG